MSLLDSILKKFRVKDLELPVSQWHGWNDPEYVRALMVYE